MSLLLQTLDGDNTRYALIGVAVMTILYVVLRPMLRRKKEPLESSPRIGLSQQRAVEREMSHVLVELSDMARQISAQLDSRAAKLEVLIQQADERLEALSAANAPSRDREGAGRAQPGLDPGSGPSESADPAFPRPTTHPPDPHHLEIYQLADQGRSPHEIADRLGRPSGEIELILALRSRR